MTEVQANREVVTFFCGRLKCPVKITCPGCSLSVLVAHEHRLRIVPDLNTKIIANIGIITP